MPAIGLCWPRNVKLKLLFPGLIKTYKVPDDCLGEGLLTSEEQGNFDFKDVGIGLSTDGLGIEVK